VRCWFDHTQIHMVLQQRGWSGWTASVQPIAGKYGMVTILPQWTLLCQPIHYTYYFTSERQAGFYIYDRPMTYISVMACFCALSLRPFPLVVNDIFYIALFIVSPNTFERLCNHFGVCVCVSVNISVVERLRLQFFTDFHQILLMNEVGLRQTGTRFHILEMCTFQFCLWYWPVLTKVFVYLLPIIVFVAGALACLCDTEVVISCRVNWNN